MLRLLIVASLVACAFGVPAGRIVGGKDTTIEEHPHQVAFLVDGFLCGGSIIAPTWILTAGHCTYGTIASGYSVHVGTTHLGLDGVIHRVKRVITHPNYNDRTVDYDYALLELQKPIQYGSKAQPIALPEQDEAVAPGITVTVTGWGRLYDGGPSADTLQVVQVKTISWQECARKIGGLSARNLCAGVPEGGKDSCEGDSGGPLTDGDKLVGIVSYGVAACAAAGVPAVYADVANQRQWIKSVSGV